MAVQASVKLTMPDDFDEDALMVFKRLNSSSKPNQIRAEMKNSSSSQKPDGQLVNYSSNGHSSSSQKGNVMPSAEPTSMRPPTGNSLGSSSASPIASILSGKNSPMMSAKPSASLGTQSRQSSRQGAPTNVKNESDSDSDDEKPLSTRMQGNSRNKIEGQSSTMQPPKKLAVQDSADSSDDEKPIASRMFQKSSVGTSSSKALASDEKKSMSSQARQNGFASSVDSRKSPVIVNKRPLEKISSSESLINHWLKSQSFPLCQLH